MFLCLGLNHRTTPLELRERLAFTPSHIPQADLEILKLPGFEESVILSTCNRVELYSYYNSDNPYEGIRLLHAYLTERFKLTAEQCKALTCYELSDTDAARHLFRVVSGLDSMVLGETEIFGQVKAAYNTALQAGSTSRALNKLFQRSFSVGKDVRNSTQIQRGTTSVGGVAVEVAEKIFGNLNDCKVLLIGAGDMSRTCAQSLLSRGAHSIVVSNRSFDRAESLAAEMGGTALRFDQWEQAVHDVDIIISSTSAPHYVVKPDLIHPVMRKRHGKPLYVIDIAVPRDVDPAVNDIEEVYLYDLDALQIIADEGRRERERCLENCHALIEQYLNKFGYLDNSYKAARPLTAPRFIPHSESGPRLPLTAQNSHP